ncbi:MAG TPA: AAA family ATPase, partial [Phormidium sp.]
TDFYSLGVTFYEMLAGQLPFSSNDPMELVHCHIAKQPRLLNQLNPEIPKPVVDIVMKLLAKTAEERYQSARGLLADLEECLKQLETSGQIKDFIVGKLDRFGQFVIPQKLYGRETEVITLMAAFERVAIGSTEMMLVSGYSGIGKTWVVQEIHKPIVRQRGYFIAGKFDQFKKNTPYSALIQAFQELIRQLLTENSKNIETWKEQLVEALGQNGRVIIDVIPEVELIMGEQPEVPQLGSTEYQNRFNRVYKQFIHVFTKPEHPLVLFLDDLQWADSASLKLLQLLITDTDSEYLLLIGAYRDNEVSPTHPTIQTIEEIKKTGTVVNNLVLQALDIRNVNQLVADTLHGNNNSIELGDLLFNKTQGNPFFLTQLFKALHSEQLLKFDFIKSCWHWDIKQIQALGIADYNVVELVAISIQKLPKTTQKILQFAACIGNRFNLDICAVINEKSPLETADDLWLALQAGLILPLSNDYKIPLAFQSEEQATLLFDESRVSYKFLHDRVQQAAYSMIPENQKKATHLKIGKLLLHQYAENALEENIFDIVNQLNIGVEFIAQPSEKNELANFNLIAGRKAKAATAYEAAVKYLNVGLELLPESSWQSQYD